MRRVATIALGAATSFALIVGPSWAIPAPVAPVTPYELPFRCGQTWSGTTRAAHSPSVDSVDFNRTKDMGQPVAVSAAGVVTVAKNLGSASYGRYVVVDHGNGESTLYAHLSAIWVVVGQEVDQATVIGQVGSTGNSSGAHLHFEERLDGEVVKPWFGGSEYAYGTATASANCVDVPIVGDWDGDGIDDIGVFRRASGVGRFRRQVGSTESVVKFARNYDQPIVGDWDGDGLADVGAWQAASTQVITKTATGMTGAETLGTIRDRAVPGDWNGDGVTDLGLWRASTGSFGVLDAVGKRIWIAMGSASDLPVVGDWNGDGVSDLGVFDPTTTTWTLRMVANDGMVWSTEIQFGNDGVLPVVGDWDGDGIDDLGTWDPATATWSLRTGDTAASRVTTRTYGRGR
jgi:hypothetical protein